MRKSLRLTLAGILFISALPPVFAQTRIPWLQNLQEAQQIARQEQRLLLIHFYSDTCPPCRRLEQVVFPNPEVYRAMSMNYVPVKINGERARDIARQFQVDRWPTDVIADAQGRVLYKTVSPQDPARYAQLLNAVAADFRVRCHPWQPPAGIAADRAPPPAMLLLRTITAPILVRHRSTRRLTREPTRWICPPDPARNTVPRWAIPTRLSPRSDRSRFTPPPYSVASAPREQINPYVGQYAPAPARHGPPQGDAYDPRSYWSPWRRTRPRTPRRVKPSRCRPTATCQPFRLGRKTALHPTGPPPNVRRRRSSKCRQCPSRRTAGDGWFLSRDTPRTGTVGERRSSLGRRPPGADVPVPVTAAPATVPGRPGPLQPGPVRIRPRALRRSRRIGPGPAGVWHVVPRKDLSVRGRAIAEPVLATPEFYASARTRS